MILQVIDDFYHFSSESDRMLSLALPNFLKVLYCKLELFAVLKRDLISLNIRCFDFESCEGGNEHIIT